MKLKPCPFCKGEIGVELIDNDDGTIYHSAKTAQCPLEGMDIPLDLWSNRPLEDAAIAQARKEERERFADKCIKDIGELVGIAMETADDLDSSLILKYRERGSKFTAIIIGKGRGDSDDSLSAALVAAIVDAKE